MNYGLSWPTKANKLMIGEGMIGEAGFPLVDWSAMCFSVIEGSSTNTCIHASPFVLLKHLELRLSVQPGNNNTHNTNRYHHVRFYTFVELPLSRQLFIYATHFFEFVFSNFDQPHNEKEKRLERSLDSNTIVLYQLLANRSIRLKIDI